jgi:Fic family protein
MKWSACSPIWRLNVSQRETSRKSLVTPKRWSCSSSPGKKITLTENHVKQLHRDLLQYSEKDAHHRGNYKTQPNNVAAFDEAGKQVGIVFETASPFDTPQRMSELVDWTSDAYASRQLHPLLVTAIFKVVLLEIHPFQDGNGRFRRILTTLLLLRAGNSYVP